MVNYDTCYVKLGDLIKNTLGNSFNNFSLENKNLGENLREMVELDIKKLCVARSHSNIEARFHVLG